MNSGQTLGLAVKHHQAGNLGEAETLYRRVLHTQPRNPDALHMLGVMAHQIGRNDLAVAYIQQAIGLHPEFPTAYNNLGIALIALGKFEEAISSYRHALHLKPNYAEACGNLGIALRDHGKLDEAITTWQESLRLKPDYAEAYHHLGNALTTQGKLDEAITYYQQALRLNPTYAEALNNMGYAFTNQGKIDDAITSYHQALRLQPNFPEAHNNLGSALTDQGKVDEAILCYRQALHLKPDYAEAYYNLGNALTNQERLDEAITCYQQALRLKSDYALAHYNLGNALTTLGRLDEAITSYRQALCLKPNDANTHCNLGHALADTGRMDQAIASFQEAIRLQPIHVEALGHLVSLLRGKLPDAHRAALEQFLAESNLTEYDRTRLLFSLAEVCNANAEYAQAAALLRRANALALSLRRQKGLRYDLDEMARFVDNVMTAFTPAFFERMRGFGLETERPVFIVGLPRSGTTLTEQILAAHSQVYGAGELSLGRADFLALGTQPTDDSVFATLPSLAGDAFRRVGRWHLDQLDALNGAAMRVVDKMPDNYFYLGLLAALFPRANFIHCRRDLRDVGVSCWMTNFKDVHWANDSEDIAARFREYQRLMDHWQTVLPVSVLEVQYEEIVADFPVQARRLVEWCGLDWESACLHFNESIRPVRTASKIQVREPIYTRSVGRWRHYEREMSELFAALNPLLDKGL
jgi:tetratricopeptide (TPR) repeat protein